MWGLLTNRLAIAGMGLVAALAAYNVGLLIGGARGEAKAVLAQSVSNERAREAIRGRIQDALEAAGVDSSDDAIDGVLEGLAGID